MGLQFIEMIVIRVSKFVVMYSKGMPHKCGMVGASVIGFDLL
jgi:hypothetical protein